MSPKSMGSGVTGVLRSNSILRNTMIGSEWYLEGISLVTQRRVEGKVKRACLQVKSR